MHKFGKYYGLNLLFYVQNGEKMRPSGCFLTNGALNGIILKVCSARDNYARMRSDNHWQKRSDLSSVCI